jgi:hypothetical protein
MAAPPLLGTAFLRGKFGPEFEAFRDTDAERALYQRLARWAALRQQNESTAQIFVALFFRETWNYSPDGAARDDEQVTLREQFAVRGAGARGRTGQADLALGMFSQGAADPTPQVLCEFKNVRSNLDASQRRKDSDRSPVQQCADYLKESSRGLRHGAVEPTWGIVSDMNEVRLYWRDTMPAQVQRFVIARPQGSLEPLVLLDDDEGARFQRFLFWRLFQRDMLLTSAGPSPLLVLMREQGARERAIESAFYEEYHRYRKAIFDALVECNPKFTGTRGELVRLTQRFLDRCIFVLFCEDMGSALNFPENVLRDLLVEKSNSRSYDPDAPDIWGDVKRLFVAMRDGTPFGERRINRFNGGLFADEPELDALVLPNRLFCTKGQGATPELRGSDACTLLFFSSQYNFGVQPTGERSIGLHTLGRVFEQSITDLELLAARAEGRPSLTELSRRKRDGVYYTPEWVTYFVVEHTVGARLAALRAAADIDGERGFVDRDVRLYQDTLGRADAGRFAQGVRAYLARLDAYEQELSNIKIVDPACGSGAFLIQALRLLVRAREWVTEERASVTGTRGLTDQLTVAREILSKNIYGVDTNAESVEIARLALWLETALPDRPLASLDATIRGGNSLVEARSSRANRGEPFPGPKREPIDTFDWESAFPEVFRGREGLRRGFDCVIGNPPYVKLQSFRQVDPEVSDYLVHARRSDGEPLYLSTQVGNFDLYLPFIERGISLLNHDGVMGYIAPSVWTMNEHGRGLRELIRRTRRLDRWIDFKDFQVFEDAITYTALQFFRGHAVDEIRCVFAPDGSVSGIDWSDADANIKYSELAEGERWLLLPAAELNLLRRLGREHPGLGEIASIVVGLQTSADHIYHLRQIESGRYLSFAAGGEAGGGVTIEEAMMRPLVSGPEAKRYVSPSTSTRLLFPYDDGGSGVPRLIPQAEMQRKFPLAWRYLKRHEEELRAREKGKFDDDEWYRFGRHQNIDKQRMRKLGVAQTVPSMRVFYDSKGGLCFNNVRVNGVLIEHEETGWFLLGVLNGAVADFVFRRGAKPKSGGYFEANKQFIAPLPVPRATVTQRAAIAAQARRLQEIHDARRDLGARLTRFFADCEVANRDPGWLWRDLPSIKRLREQNPKALTGKALTDWARQQHGIALAHKLTQLSAKLRPGCKYGASLLDGVLKFEVDGAAVLHVYVAEDEAPLLLAHWSAVARTQRDLSAKRLIAALLSGQASSNGLLRAQIARTNASIEQMSQEIRAAEAALNEALYALYGLTDQERILVENDRLMVGTS